MHKAPAPARIAPRIAGALTVALVAVLAAPAAPAQAQSEQAEVTREEAEAAARSVARHCKILINRIDELIEDEWATQDLKDLAAVWDGLNCHNVFGVDERVRWLVR